MLMEVLLEIGGSRKESSVYKGDVTLGMDGILAYTESSINNNILILLYDNKSKLHIYIVILY